jgi:hypothetical protein
MKKCGEANKIKNYQDPEKMKAIKAKMIKTNLERTGTKSGKSREEHIRITKNHMKIVTNY